MVWSGRREEKGPKAHVGEAALLRAPAEPRQGVVHSNADQVWFFWNSADSIVNIARTPVICYTYSYGAWCFVYIISFNTPKR